MSYTKLLLTGATGYVGGTILTRLGTSPSEEIKQLTISVLVRKPEQAEVYSAKGITPILFQDLKDVKFLRQVASEHDIIIHTADSTNPEAAEAFIYGLADRAKTTGKAGELFHLSGTSSLGDNPITKRFLESREFSDEEDIYGYMKYREAIDSYSQRATDIKTVQIGEEVGVRTYIIKAPRIYGRGTGLFNQKSAHIPWLIAGALAVGQAEFIGDGAGIWDDVHITDVADLFEILLDKVLRAESIPSGSKGIYFAASLRHSWKELAEGIAAAGVKLGYLASSNPKQMSLEEAAQKYTGGNLLTAEVGLASNSLTIAKRAFEMGWKPKAREEDFQHSILEDFKLMYALKKADA
ncbi:hypothetical protein B0J13DRAFT_501276 [Dactylonectria estremocensis]|uniref:NAD-dependent epimerase/dehydratase domain-containing protein n=1 Tax=Dactylonectria estremocensis TaxID=1079267 RepID=A0A9P9ER79_9HYPO|nr:hypothetical protein B0J13DRAFT_501276 [Dactylonectria estremocensis]